MTKSIVSCRSTSRLPTNDAARCENSHSRRQVLLGVACLPAVPAATLAAPTPDPLVALGQLCHRYYTWEGLPKPSGEDDDPLMAAYSAEWSRLLAEIAATPARSMAGVGVKVKLLILEITDGQTAHGDELARGLLADVERLGGRATHG